MRSLNPASMALACFTGLLSAAAASSSQPLAGAVPGVIFPALFFAHLVLHHFSDLFPEPPSLNVTQQSVTLLMLAHRMFNYRCICMCVYGWWLRCVCMGNHLLISCFTKVEVPRGTWQLCSSAPSRSLAWGLRLHPHPQLIVPVL